MALVNGKLPDALLVAAAGSSGARLRVGTAGRWAWVRVEVHRRFGWWPEITGPTDGYRTLQVQINTLVARYDHTPRVGSTIANGALRYWDGRYWYRKPGQATAATPGQSNHGWAKACDVAGLGGFDGARYDDFAQVAAEAGFSNAAGRTIGEWWHWEDQHDPDVITVTAQVSVQAGGATSAPTPPHIPAPVPEEDIVASLADVQNAVQAEVTKALTPVQAALDKILGQPPRAPWPLRCIEGTTLAWWDLGAERRIATGAQAGTYGSQITAATLTDPFWLLPIVGSEVGQVYHRPGQQAAWAVLLRDGHLVRQWITAAAYDAAGRPDNAELPAGHAIWGLPTVGDLPTEGA